MGARDKGGEGEEVLERRPEGGVRGDRSQAWAEGLSCAFPGNAVDCGVLKGFRFLFACGASGGFVSLVVGSLVAQVADTGTHLVDA